MTQFLALGAHAFSGDMYTGARAGVAWALQWSRLRRAGISSVP